jgi:predicted kinase
MTHMNDNPTRLEAGHNHVLAYCASCPPWRELAWDRPEALEAAAVHVQLVHDRPQLAERLRKRASATRRAGRQSG